MKTTIGRLAAWALLSAPAAAALACATGAHAQAVDEKYWIEASAYFPSTDTSLTINRPNITGTRIDFEHDLGGDDSQTLPAVYAGARFGRWVVFGEYYGLDRSGSKTISRDLVFDGVTFPASAQVDSKMKSDVYRLSLGYDLVKTDKAELGLSLGLHATDFDIELATTRQIGNGATQRQTSGHTFLAPQPTVGLFGGYEIAPKWIIAGRVDYLSISIDKYDGSILNLQASAAYRATPAISVGAAWRYVDYQFDVKQSSYTATVDYHFSGPSLFVRYGFH